MVRFVHSTHSQFHPSVAGKWLVWGTLMMLLAGVAIIVFSVFSHDALDACCNCIICTFNRVPKEGEIFPLKKKTVPLTLTFREDIS